MIKFTLVILSVTAIFTSCQKDDSELIVGKWIISSMVIYDWLGKEFNVEDKDYSKVGYIFNADGTVNGTAIVNNEEIVTENVGRYDFENKIFKIQDQNWKVTKLTGNDLSLEYEPANLSYEYAVMQLKKVK